MFVCIYSRFSPCIGVITTTELTPTTKCLHPSHSMSNIHLSIGITLTVMLKCNKTVGACVQAYNFQIKTFLITPVLYYNVGNLIQKIIKMTRNISLSLVQREPKNSNCQDIKMIRYTQQRQITFLAILGMKAQLQNHKCNPIALFKFQFENTSEWLCLTTRVLSIHNDVKQGKTKYADSRKLQCLVVGLPLCCSLLYVMNQILCVKMI